MKFTLEIELSNEAMLYAHNVQDALHRSMNSELQHKANLPLVLGQGATIKDINGNTVGKWEVTESAKTPKVFHCPNCAREFDEEDIVDLNS